MPKAPWLALVFFTHTFGASHTFANVPNGFAETQIAGGLSSPTAMAIAPDGRIFVCEQGGRLRVVKNGTLLTTPFLSLPVDSTGERGLLGVAFDPNFVTNRFIYVYYTATTPNVHNRLSRFRANGDVVAAGTETVLADLDPLSSATNHNGGAIHFGQDGKLYVAVGDNANRDVAQSLTSLFGKLLRVNADGTIPSDNPFFSTTTGNRRSIWAVGLRNPFTFAIQPGTGNIFINDVGEVSWEEINRGVRGGNYGWPTTEGHTSDSRFVSPLYAYDHNAGCSITGGAFYNPSTPGFPSSYTGDYFFGDYCGGWIRTRDSSTGSIQTFATNLGELVDIQIDPRDGSLYYLSRTGGTLFQVRYTANPMPAIATHPANQTVPVGQTATFSCSASGTAPLSYQWQRNSSNVSGATSASYSIQSVQVADHGSSYRCLVTNAFGNALSNQALLTVISSNTAPTGTVTAPVAGTLFRPGVAINYSGTATDPQDGSLPASAFTWKIDFHHADHVHPFLQETTGSKSGSFVPAAAGHTSRNVFYRITLRVRDSGGLTHTSTRDIRPSPLPVPSTLQIEDAATATAGTGVPGGWGLNANGYVEDNFNFLTSGSICLPNQGTGGFRWRRLADPRGEDQSDCRGFSFGEHCGLGDFHSVGPCHQWRAPSSCSVYERLFFTHGESQPLPGRVECDGR